MARPDASPGSMPWLRPPPQGFRTQCEALDIIEGDRTAALRRLASFALNESQLLSLGRCLGRAEGKTASLAPFKLGLVSNATTDFIVPALRGTGVRYGFSLAVIAAPFGMTLQAALAPDLGAQLGSADAILLALDYRAYFSDYALRDTEAEAVVETALAQLSGLLNAFQANSRATMIIQTIAPPPERLLGSFDRQQRGTPAWLAAHFNARLVKDLLRPGVSLLDVESLANHVGLGHWFDRGQYMTARLPFAGDCVPLYADHVLRVVTALRGRSGKVLVLDLDNTLWGGVIGDDGLDGIRVGQGDPQGEAFLDVQRAALALKQRGVLLAVCSKNTETVALDAIRRHPEMLLRMADFSAWAINWQDKATNLETLARRLSLGLDSFVFLDDNPAERDQVRQALPMVCVPELPSDPAAYARLLLTAGLFETVTFSEEDRSRVSQYAANASRESLLAQSRNLGDFLRSLQMQATFTVDGAVGWARFAQLINKSNQFNLTTRRYTEAELQPLIADPATLTLQVRLTDQFGDNGLISAIVARPQGGDWLLDTWVMSCRVLGREVEQAVLNEIVAEARQRKIARLIGVYRPTDRNDMVKDHYSKLGFSPAPSTIGESRWELEVASYVGREVPISIFRQPPGA